MSQLGCRNSSHLLINLYLKKRGAFSADSAHLDSRSFKNEKSEMPRQNHQKCIVYKYEKVKSEKVKNRYLQSAHGRRQHGAPR